MLDEVADSAWLLAARPATPIFNAPYKLILRFLQGGLEVFDRVRLRFDAVSRRRCFKTSKSIRDRGDIREVYFHVADDQAWRAARQIDLGDDAGAGDGAVDGCACRVIGGNRQLIGAIGKLLAAIVLAIPG